VCARLGYLGIRLDEAKNASLTGDGVASADTAVPAVVIIQAREDIEIARHVRALLAARPDAPPVVDSLGREE